MASEMSFLPRDEQTEQRVILNFEIRTFTPL